MIQALQAPQGLQDLLEQTAQCQDLPVQQAQLVQTVQLETQDLPVLPVTLDLLVQQEPTVQQDQLDQPEIPVQQDRLVILGLPDLLVLTALQVQQDQQVILGRLVRQDLQVQMEQQVQRGQQGRPVQRVLQVILGQQDLQALMHLSYSAYLC